MTTPVLDVENLAVAFDSRGGRVRAVRGVSFSVASGETLAIVGESGCGKSATAQAILGLLPAGQGRVTSGTVRLHGDSILGLPEKEANRVRGNRIGMIFQDPMTALNPTMKVGDQIAETLRVHRGLDRRASRARAVELLQMTRLPDAAQRAGDYPFAFSGGMLQRVMIAMSLACEPDLLIADEPTTALDVTIQAQILTLIRELQRSRRMALILITHDLGIVAQMADRVAVMYAGQIAETGSVDDIFYRPAHPYTLGLRASLPQDESHRQQALQPIPGSPPDLHQPPPGCSYCPRCPHAMRLCRDHDPGGFVVGVAGESAHLARCWLQHPEAPKQEDGLWQPQ
ncbi:MAG: ABC transporter ATP-binding protein [Oceanospirillaceae bacterium]|nr:ABC transporter ATP-binding protein [Oceanospirillaceae bacterium]